MSTIQLSQINVFPVKSIGGISLSKAWVESQGLTFDRRFMVATPDGTMVTARKYPNMVNIHAALQPDGFIFTYPDVPPFQLRYDDLERKPQQTQVWKDEFEALSTSQETNRWFSDVIGIDVQLLYCGEQSARFREKIKTNVSFADGYPLLVISEGSLEELNARSSEKHSMDQFRTNLVVSGTEPFAEDGWKRIRIGEVEFEAVKPCERCILTTVNTKTGTFRESKEPLKTLSEFRANERGGVFFGQNLVAKNEGIIRAGDCVEVLETKPKEEYEDKSKAKLILTCVERETIARDFITFWLEPSKGTLPGYLPGQHLPIEIDTPAGKLSRRYTLSSSPTRPGRYAISVKRIDEGAVSNWLHDRFQVGDTLVADSPDGAFHLTNATNPLLLISAGSGVTPMLSMLRYLSDHDQVNNVVFYHQCRSERDIPCRSELEKLNMIYPGLRVMVSLTQPEDAWHGLKGRLSLSHIKKIPDLNSRQVFVCGPNGFMAQTKSLLFKMGLDESLYHQEAFGVAKPNAIEEKSIQITVNGQSFTGTNQKPLLMQAEDAGINIANSCRAGLCGACRVKVVSGEFETPDVPAIMPGDKEDGIVLACCSTPLGDVEVDSN
ncbi:hybrid-cluster NAD(P)-dependent oxidoreductase [Vibrio nigripulchritudo]|uniref:hybrid-cluster NAD(P)-dependent oxidoreductase n=1 Tax=Vibrio nigripulchritudo TaxID=28173 RepID=UPI0005FA1C11|nr:hybrid-cluster NAD(P)-dependent oxidoreductase [Vibrio nigripulchritudo]KJY67928.1 flavodoxin [Vibrio nigripulchritudo]